MLRKQVGSMIVWFVISLVGFSAGADDPEPKRVPPQIPETQLTLRVGPIQGRATVIAVADATLTVVTAAHFLSETDIGKTILIRQSERLLRGHVAAVARNPKFHTVRARNSDEMVADGTLGVDTEIAAIQVDLHRESEHRFFETIKSAELTTGPIPSRPGQIVSVHIVDQFGKEHVVRAGNHLNPKCLAWGNRFYDVHPGDSGSGVFLIRKTPEGESWPILIGNVSQTDERGGIASLTNRNEPWIEKALEPQQAQQSQ